MVSIDHQKLAINHSAHLRLLFILFMLILQ
jgi:hypothetical protein